MSSPRKGRANGRRMCFRTAPRRTNWSPARRSRGKCPTPTHSTCSAFTLNPDHGPEVVSKRKTCRRGSAGDPRSRPPLGSRSDRVRRGPIQFIATPSVMAVAIQRRAGEAVSDAPRPQIDRRALTATSVQTPQNSAGIAGIRAPSAWRSAARRTGPRAPPGGGFRDPADRLVRTRRGTAHRETACTRCRPRAPPRRPR